MAGHGFPLAVEVVRHDVEEVEVRRDGGDVVAALDGLGPGGHGRR